MGRNLLQQVLGGVGKVASIAAPFLPGPWGAVAGIAGGLIGASNDSRRAGGYAGTLDEQARQMLAERSPLLAALKAQAGIGADGSFDPNFNPYAQMAEGLYDPDSLTNAFVASQEATAPNYDAAVNSARADLSRRGFGGMPNSLITSAVGNIRGEQASENAQARRGLLWNLAQQKKSFLNQGLDVRNQALNNAFGTASASAQGALGTIGGLQGFYENRANQTMQGVGDLVKQGSEAGVFDGITDKVSGWLKARTGWGRPRIGTPPIVPGGGGYVPRLPGGAAGTVGWGK